jgi:hypothetical protein
MKLPRPPKSHPESPTPPVTAPRTCLHCRYRVSGRMCTVLPGRDHPVADDRTCPMWADKVAPMGGHHR